MKSKPAVIFDLGGVLIDWNPRYLYRKMFRDEASIDKFFSETRLLEWNEKQDEGRSFGEAVSLLSSQFPHYAEHISAFHGRWLEMIGGAIEHSVAVLSDLRDKGYDLFALSNWSAETYPLARGKFEFLDWFDEVVISGEQKVIKPDPRIFLLLLTRIARPAEECVYIDDSERNIEAARSLGFKSIQFKSGDQLIYELAGHGILIE